MRGTRKPQSTTSTSATAPWTILCSFYRWVSRSGDLSSEVKGNCSGFSSPVAGCLENMANGVGILALPTGKPRYPVVFHLSTQAWLGGSKKSVCSVKAFCFRTERAGGILISPGVCLCIPPPRLPPGVDMILLKPSLLLT